MHDKDRTAMPCPATHSLSCVLPDKHGKGFAVHRVSLPWRQPLSCAVVVAVRLDVAMRDGAFAVRRVFAVRRGDAVQKSMLDGLSLYQQLF
jgi:hypothetical protein